MKDYHERQPDLKSPEVDWEEFNRDYKNRKEASHMLSKVKTIENFLMNIKILSDYDNYSDALKDYQYSKYKNQFGNQMGYSGKIEAMRNFFPKTGKTKKKKDL